METFRCSWATRERGDAVSGSATAINALVLLEDPGPYGYKAWLDGRLPKGLGAEVVARGKAAGVRPQLIRRGDRLKGAKRRLFIAYAGADRSCWVQASHVDDPREILDLDWEGLGRGECQGLEDWHEPLIAVCTHGRHDACCAERGRPVFGAMSQAAPDVVWQTSHLGGDRYAANALAMVGGDHVGAFMFGHIEPENAGSIAQAFVGGRVDLDVLRGRTCWDKPVQAAEVALRMELSLTSLGGVVFLGMPEAGLVRLSTEGREWLVTVAESETEPVQLSCHKPDLEPAVSWRAVSVSPV